jgi:Ca2+-binding EF-hand superfamily protein
MDADQDGALSREEVKAYFQRRHADSEKKLPKAEGDAASGERDKRGGRSRGPHLTPERLAEVLKKFPEADADKNGKLEPQELRTYVHDNPEARRELRMASPRNGERRGKGPASRPADAKPRRGAGKEPGPEAREQISQRLLEKHPQADLDKDGKISPEEFRAFRGTQKGSRPGKTDRPNARKQSQS